MNKSALKRFATQTRLDLMAMVNTKLGYLLSLDESSLPIEYRDHAANIQKIKERCSKNGKIDNEIKDDFVEEVAYTWFNRLIALRFMDANEITDFAVISTSEEQILPPIYTKAKEGTIDKDLRLDRDKFFSLIDGKISASNPDNEAYKMLFIAVCNYYSSLMPFMFESISDYTELLLPDDMLSLNSIRAVVVDAMPADDCKDVEIIGWLYQFYIAQKKDDVFAALKKNKKITASNIPAATQLFTPDWIVKYMVENSLGKLWMLNNPSSALKEQMKYYIENPDEITEFIKISSPEEITLLDPCMGSGHILTYAFDLLTKIYEEAGFNTSDIPTLILENNLYGCDIDKRAATLAQFALTMKARIYYRRFFRNPITLNAIELQDFGSEEFASIKNFGSLLTPKAQSEQFVEGVFAHNTQEYELQKRLLISQYHCVVTNPPYMGGKGMNKELADFLKNNFPSSKSDLFAAFIEKSIEFTMTNGSCAMITMQSWMFLSTLEKIRKYIIHNHKIDSLVHIGFNSFPELNSKIALATSFVIQKDHQSGLGIYINLNDVSKTADKEKVFLKKLAKKDIHLVASSKFDYIDGSPITYWLSDDFRNIFEKYSNIKKISPPKVGLKTGLNDRFLRYWYEVNFNSIGFGFENRESAKISNLKWFPYNKGGSYRKWYGNNEYVVNWQYDGQEIIEWCNYLNTIHVPGGVAVGKEYYFRKALTWSFVNVRFGARYREEGYLFDVQGSSAFPNEEDIFYVLAVMNSNVSAHALEAINPTLSYQAGNIASLPINLLIDSNKKDVISSLVAKNIEISKAEWNLREISFGFKKNMLLNYTKISKIEDVLSEYSKFWFSQFELLKSNEEAINKLLIEDMSLTDDVSFEVDSKDVSILSDQLEVSNNQYVFNHNEIMKQLISYSVGVMFGRYTPSQEGLVVANVGQKYPTDTSFIIDDDNIIPVLEDDYFTDDIASRFIEFVKVSFGEEHHTENIQFIENILGMTIRKYFVSAFFEDHYRRFNKRPIYWMVSSPQKSFNALIYMHRYQDDIFARVQNNYLREYITKLEAAMHTATTIANDESNSAADRRKATKDIETITKKIDELIKFDRDKLTPFAQSRTPIDLDDGVKVNYSKFEEILYPIPGLKSEE